MQFFMRTHDFEWSSEVWPQAQVSVIAILKGRGARPFVFPRLRPQHTFRCSFLLTRVSWRLTVIKMRKCVFGPGQNFGRSSEQVSNSVSRGHLSLSLSSSLFLSLFLSFSLFLSLSASLSLSFSLFLYLYLLSLSLSLSLSVSLSIYLSVHP